VEVERRVEEVAVRRVWGSKRAVRGGSIEVGSWWVVIQELGPGAVKTSLTVRISG
jgi:hypothetical protein